MVNVGIDSYVRVEEIETISPPISRPIKRIIEKAKDEGRCIELLYGRAMKSVIILKSGTVVLSSTLPKTLVSRIAAVNSNPLQDKAD